MRTAPASTRCAICSSASTCATTIASSRVSRNGWSKETSDLREDVKKRLTAIEGLIRQEVESLSERLKNEQDERSTAAKDLARELNDRHGRSSGVPASWTIRWRAGLRDLRQQLHEQHQGLSDELRRQAEDLLARLSRESQELRGDKADRTALAALFTEMAMRLNGEFRLPGGRGRAGVPDAAARAAARPGGGHAEPVTEFAELRSLIIGPEQRELRALEARISDPGRVARDVSAVLPEAVLLRKHDPQLTRALAPTIEEAITNSVRQNPQPLADALFPVIGPAIRKAIAASLSGMLETLNRTLEHSLSWRAVQWRLTALRTGTSFAEVVLLNTLVYRVEQVLLIDRRTGLLLQHVTEGSTPAQDADMVSGMLTAIRDFAHDSFRVSENEALETLQVGDVTVWVEQGPYAILAAVIRGTAPRELRTALQEVLEYVHAYHGEALRAFSGDAAPFEKRASGARRSAARRVSAPREAGVAADLGRPGDPGARWPASGWCSPLQARARWNGYLDALRAEPGIVVVSAERRGGGGVCQRPARSAGA